MEAHLRRQVRMLEIGLIVIAAVVGLLVVGGQGSGWAAPESAKRAAFDEIVVKRISVVNAKAVRHMMQSPDAPSAIHRGRSFPRHGV